MPIVAFKEAHVKAPAWQGEAHDLLKNEFDVSQFSYVPDAGHRELINDRLRIRTYIRFR